MKARPRRGARLCRWRAQHVCRAGCRQRNGMDGGDREDGEMTPRLDETVLAGLMTIGQDDPAFVARIFGLFEQNAEPAMQKVQQACESNQHIELADAVHALKSMALNIGAARLAATCAGIEAKARAGETIDLGSACKAVSRDLNEALDELRNRFDAA
jgi:HPt (histidine-containing phosphotransfer) domain-containing protein